MVGKKMLLRSPCLSYIIIDQIKTGDMNVNGANKT